MAIKNLAGLLDVASGIVGPGEGNLRQTPIPSPFRPLLPILLLAAASCSSDAVAPPDEDLIASVSVVASSDEIEIEGSTPATATVLTAGGADVTSSTTITWSSTAANVAHVSGTGASVEVIGISPGVATIEASAGGRSGSASITVMSPPPRVTTASLRNGEVGNAYSDTLEAVGGDGTFAWSVASGGLPDGLTLDAATGEISGTPTLADAFDFTVEVTSGGRSDDEALGIVIAPAGGPAVRMAVVNVDYMSSVQAGLDTVYVGADGVFSTTGGTHWNPADAGTGVTGALDEFGDATTVDVAMNVIGEIFIGAATNELQDNGIVGSGIPENGFEWRGLVADSVYDLAFYVYAEVALSAVTSLDVTHAGGTTTVGPNAEPTWTLPGEEGEDYLLLEGVAPFEIEPNVWGFRIDNLDERGAIMGLQLRGPVRDP